MNRASESHDILDKASQQFNRGKSDYISPLSQSAVRQDLMMKQLYRQQLDDIMKDKTQQRLRQKEREMQEKQAYNQRLNYGLQSERLKDLSYKNYYQLLLNNQAKMTQNYSGLNVERENLKQHLIQKGIEEERAKSQRMWQAEQAKLHNDKIMYRQELDRQLNQKFLKTAHEREEKNKFQEEYKKISFNPTDVAKMERDRKMIEMSKYREDLEKLTPSKGEKTRIITGSNIVGKGSNDFNIYNTSFHNPMTNPMPYNIQNPYLLKQLVRKQQVARQSNNFGSPFEGNMRP